jgi:monofunctional biosynthetic peptidoglycan transglycosylase
VRAVPRRVWIVAGAVLALCLATGWFIVLRAALPRVSALATRVPRRTALMLQREAEARAAHRSFRIDQRWVPIDRVAPILRASVLVAEDDAFFSHGGLDWKEIRSSAERNLEAGRIVRGGSTITQQLAKNLYLGGERTLTRKGEEVVLALRIERALSKRRILELYLNLIEWGDGVFGIEAAARRYYGVSAASLDARQSARLAAIIINPRRYSPVQPAPRIEKRARMILGRLRRRGLLSESEYLAAIGPEHPHGFWDWIFGGRPSSPPPPLEDDGSGDSTPVPADSLDAAPDDTLQSVR